MKYPDGRSGVRDINLLMRITYCPRTGVHSRIRFKELNDRARIPGDCARMERSREKFITARHFRRQTTSKKGEQMQKSGRTINPFDLNRDGVVTLPEMEEAVKRSFSNVKHDVTELKKVQEHGLAELNRIRKDLDEFVHRDDFTASSHQVQEFVRLLEKNLHEKEGKILKHMAVLENRMSRLISLVMEGTELKGRLATVEKQAKDFEGVMDLSHLNRKLHDEILRISSDLLALKHSVRDDLQDKMAGLEKQLAGLSGTDSFITRAELDGVAEELRGRQSAHISRIDQQLSSFNEHFSAVEELLERRKTVEADLLALREHLSAAGEFLRLEKEALPAREEFRRLNERVGRIEGQLKQEIRKEVARELAKHDEKMTRLENSLDTLRRKLVHLKKKPAGKKK